MNETARTVFWRVSILGIGASVVFYGLSFDYKSADKLFPWVFPLFLVLFVLQIFLIFQHRESAGTWRWRWNELTEGKPAWISFAYYLLIAICLGHFLWTAQQEGAGSAAIIDGQYVLDSHGHILKDLSADEYFHLRAMGLRNFATLFLFLYFVHAVFWYYPQPQRAADEV